MQKVNKEIDLNYNYIYILEMKNKNYDKKFHALIFLGPFSGMNRDFVTWITLSEHFVEHLYIYIYIYIYIHELTDSVYVKELYIKILFTTLRLTMALEYDIQRT